MSWQLDWCFSYYSERWRVIIHWRLQYYYYYYCYWLVSLEYWPCPCVIIGHRGFGKAIWVFAGWGRIRCDFRYDSGGLASQSSSLPQRFIFIHCLSAMVNHRLSLHSKGSPSSKIAAKARRDCSLKVRSTAWPQVLKDLP